MSGWQPYIRDPGAPCAACGRSHCQEHPIPGSSLGLIRADGNVAPGDKEGKP